MPTQVSAAVNTAHLYALVAGESSGDTLGAGLMRAILRSDPKASFIGIGGEKMIKAGLTPLGRMEVLSVMGIFEVASHLMPILKLRSELIKQLLKARPCVVIGIDSPDFNLGLEKRMRRADIPTVHYVSPSVWAWREGRMKKIKEACDEVLALLPFEKEFYDREGMPCTYVGHTLANQIPLQVSQDESKAQIELEKTSVEPVQGKVMAILAGSRKNELVHMVPVYAQTARIIKEKMPDVVFISACPDKERAEMLKDLWLSHAPDLSLTIYIGCTHAVIGAADAVLLTSGTIAFETMLLKRPMAVAYKVNPLTALIGRRLLKINMFSLPNLLAKRRIVAEFIQEQCTPEALAQEMLKLLTSDNLLMKNEFLSMHKAMIKNSDEIAAKAVLSLIKKSGIKTVESKDNKAFNGMVEPSFTVPANIAGTDRAARQEPRL